MKNLKNGWNVAKGYLDKIPSPKKLVEKFNSWEHEKSLSLEDKLESNLNNSENSLIKQKGLEALNWLNDPSNYEGIKENLHEKIKLGKEKFMQVKLIGQCSLEDIVQIREEGGPLIDSFEPLKYELTKQRDWNDVKDYFKGDMLRKTLPLATLMMWGLGDSSITPTTNHDLENIANANATYVTSGTHLINEDLNIVQVSGISDLVIGPQSYISSEESDLSVLDMAPDSQEILTNHSMAEVTTLNNLVQDQENQNEFRVYHFGEEEDGVNSLLGLANKYYPGEDSYTTLFNFLIDNPNITNPNMVNIGQEILLDVNGYTAQFKSAEDRSGFINWVGNMDSNTRGLTFNNYMAAAGVDINDPKEVSEFTINYVNSERANAGWSTNPELSQETFGETIPKNEVGIPVVEKVKYSPVENNEVHVEEASTPISLYNPRNIVRVIPSQEDLNGYGVLRHWNPRGQIPESLPASTEVEVVRYTSPEEKVHSEIEPLTLEDEIVKEYNHAEVLEKMSELNNFVTPGSIDLYSLVMGRISNDESLIEVAPETESIKLPNKLMTGIKDMYSGVTDFFSNFSEHWNAYLESIPGITVTPEIETPEDNNNNNSVSPTIPFDISREIEYPNPLSARDLISDSIPIGMSYRLDLESLEFEGINNPEDTNEWPRNIDLQFYSPRGNRLTDSIDSNNPTSSNGLGYWDVRNANSDINFRGINYIDTTTVADTTVAQLDSIALGMDTTFSDNGYTLTVPTQPNDSTRTETDHRIVGLNAANGIINSIPPTNGIHPPGGNLTSADSSVAEARRLSEFNPSIRTGLPQYTSLEGADINFGLSPIRYVSFFEQSMYSDWIGMSTEERSLVEVSSRNVSTVDTLGENMGIPPQLALEVETVEPQVDRFAQEFYNGIPEEFQSNQGIDFEGYNNSLGKREFDGTYVSLRGSSSPATSQGIPLENANPLVTLTVPIAPDTVVYSSLTLPVNVDAVETADAIPQNTTGHDIGSSINEVQENNNASSAGPSSQSVEDVIQGLGLPNNSGGLATTYNPSGQVESSTNQETYQDQVIGGGPSATGSGGIDDLMSSGVLSVVDTGRNVDSSFMGTSNYSNVSNEFNLMDIYVNPNNIVDVVITREFGETGILRDYNLRIFSREGDLIDERTGSFNGNPSVTLNYTNLPTGNLKLVLGANGYSEDNQVWPIPAEWETENITIGSNPVTKRTQLDKGVYGASKLPEHLKPVKYESIKCPLTEDMWVQPIEDEGARFEKEIARMLKKKEENKYIA